MRDRQQRLPRATDEAHRFLREILAPGDRCVDATAGNGHDTLFLAKCVGAGGEVFAFDVQPEAIESTRARLEAAGCAERVRLFQTCHSRIGESVEGAVKAVMFNLGYLPGGDKNRITRPDTTLAAIEAASVLLEPGGRMTVVVYPGHAGGDVEAEAVEQWARSLDQGMFGVAAYRFLNQANLPPFLIVISKT